MYERVDVGNFDFPCHAHTYTATMSYIYYIEIQDDF